MREVRHGTNYLNGKLNPSQRKGAYLTPEIEASRNVLLAQDSTGTTLTIWKTRLYESARSTCDDTVSD